MINIVQVGYGYWGSNVARNIMASSTTNLHAICDNSPQGLERAKKTFSSAVEYSADYKMYLTDPKVDAFAVVTQTEYSYQIALDVLNSGKHLFIEKPIAIDAIRAQAICELAKNTQRVVHCDHIMIYHPIIRYIKQYYDSGELGELIYYDAVRVNLGPIRLDVNSMLDLSVHDLAVIDYLTSGKEPSHVEAIGERFYGDHETLTYLTMKYPGFIAHIKSSWISPLKERRIVIGGTKKMLVFDDLHMTNKLTIYDQGIVQKGDEYGQYEFKVRTGDMTAPFIPHEDALKNSIEHFAYCIMNSKASLSGSEQALRVVKILDKAMANLSRNESNP